VPAGYQIKCPHVLYTDATIMGSIKYNDFNPGEKALQLFRKETLKYIERVKYVFTFNEWTKQSLIEDFHVEDNKVINVGFGANLDPYHGEKDYTNNQILIVLRRGLEKSKGLLLLLEAFKIVHKKNTTIKLSVVGTTLEPIEGVTYYEGYPRKKTIELFQQASLFAMPALFEPNGMVYIEALACKTPVLGLDRLAFPEFSGNGKFGFIVDDNCEKISQTIQEVLDAPEKLKRMGEEGQKYVSERFNWNIVINKILEANINKYL
jgi:glycosyltransferase involved in cell wall biosynthesis